MAGNSKRWLANVTVYTLAGALSSTLVGGFLGALGRLLLPEPLGALGLAIAIVGALAALARELGWLALPLPQLGRQTKDFWTKMFPGTLVAAMWGFDLGLIFTTWLTFSGVWVLAVVAFLGATPAFGAALFGLYWCGRALSVWLAPLLMPDASATPHLLEAITGQYRLLRRIHALGLLWLAAVLAVWLVRAFPW